MVLAILALEFTQFLLVSPIAALFSELPADERHYVSSMLAMGFTRLLQIACIYVVAVKSEAIFIPPFKPTFSLTIMIGGSALLYAVVFLGIYIQTQQGTLAAVQRLSLFLTIQTIIGPLAEELFFRGILYAAMRSKFNVIVSAISSSLLFAAAHLLGEMPLEWLIMPFAGSLIMSFIYEKGKSLPLCASLHMIFNMVAIVASA